MYFQEIFPSFPTGGHMGPEISPHPLTHTPHPHPPPYSATPVSVPKGWRRILTWNFYLVILFYLSFQILGGGGWLLKRTADESVCRFIRYSRAFIALAFLILHILDYLFASFMPTSHLKRRNNLSKILTRQTFYFQDGFQLDNFYSHVQLEFFDLI